MERRTHGGGPQCRRGARERPGVDPALALLVAVISVLLALALGTALFLMLPAAI